MEPLKTSSIVLCTKDRRDDLARCLDSLLTQRRAPDEVVVVDSGSDDAQAVVDTFAKALPQCEVRYLHSEPGLTKQRNIGIGVASKDILHFLDDDVVLDPGYIEEIQKTYEAPGGDDIIAVGPVLSLPRPQSRLMRIYRRAFLWAPLDGDGRMLASGFPSLTWFSNYRDVHPIAVGCGCCTFRADVFKRMSFDEWFEGYGYMEDIDFTYRVGQTGRMVGNPRAQMLHLESPSARLNWRRLTAMQMVNHRYVFTKHMPRDFRHELCFWWSELGATIWRMAHALKLRECGIVLGIVDGFRAIAAGNLRSVRK